MIRAPKRHNVEALNSYTRHDFSQTDFDLIGVGTLIRDKQTVRWAVEELDPTVDVKLTRGAFAVMQADDVPKRFTITFGRKPRYTVREVYNRA